MSALFSPKSNALLMTVLAVVGLGAAGTIGGLLLYWRTPYGLNVATPVVQPVQFDHRHHVQDDLIDCRYCHSSVDKAPSAGIPSTELCLACHSQVWNKSPLLDQVRASWFQDQPIRWTRVHKLPDFVYFNHAIHVNKGVGCVECHGRVDQMAAIEQALPLTMGFCLDCHRNPQPRLRPLEEIANLRWVPPADRAALGAELAKKYDVKPKVNCTTCHR
ncbi:MAG: cytochrome c3 family protein [Anaeromyxobacter sp.]|nr:cytochrome c3 family protein [Anaeromyxobacter sp.]MBL0276405.1 cytochrome c3 family protein [Anaeromyxobacter sp.]